jgi:hypothetical protein
VVNYAQVKLKITRKLRRLHELIFSMYLEALMWKKRISLFEEIAACDQAGGH